MRSAEKLLSSMRRGRVYRRQELGGLSTAVDRDLRTLLESGEVRKVAWGLYWRPPDSLADFTTPDQRGLVRAFLKSDDFLVLSEHPSFGGLRLHDQALVYNHKRAGAHVLGGRRFDFRIVRAYPKAPSREYLLVDFLNHVAAFPERAELVAKGLRGRLHEFDRDQLLACLERYGHAAAKELFQGISEGSSSRVPRVDMAPRLVSRDEGRSDLDFWLAKSPEERVDAVEILREQYYALSGCKSLPRLAHCLLMRRRPA